MLRSFEENYHSAEYAALKFRWWLVLIFRVILGLTFENLTRVTEDPLPLGLPTKVHPVEITSNYLQTTRK